MFRGDQLRCLTILVFVFIYSVPIMAESFYITASRNAIVRQESKRQSKPLLKLTAGEQLNLVTKIQTNAFYQVILPNGKTGWVSRYVVRLKKGLAVNAPVSGEHTPELSDLTAEQKKYAANHLLLGQPQGQKLLIRKGYVASYSPTLKIPLWVQYRLTKENSVNDTHLRSNKFDDDAQIPPESRAELDDYANSGYARGHMVPTDDMRWDEKTELESNLLTNIVPQVGSSFNGSVWKTLEDRIRKWVLVRDDLIIIMGPVFKAQDKVTDIPRQPVTDKQIVFNVIGKNHVAVPNGFFKIVVDVRNKQHPSMIAFYFPHIETVPGPERKVETYITSINEIEAMTGLDFLSDLPDDIEEQIEKHKPSQLW